LPSEKASVRRIRSQAHAAVSLSAAHRGQDVRVGEAHGPPFAPRLLSLFSFDIEHLGRHGIFTIGFVTAVPPYAASPGARMSFEIERKFLVCGNDWQQLATRQLSLRQAYLAANGKASVRIRIKGDGVATLTVKSRPVDLRRLELEYDIPVLEAEALMQLRQGAIIEKVRHVIPCGDLAWEVDVFSGENLGLVIAEIELRHERQHIELPPWVGAEITGQPQYYNSSLVQRPFCAWSRADAPMAIERLA